MQVWSMASTRKGFPRMQAEASSGSSAAPWPPWRLARMRCAACAALPSSSSASSWESQRLFPISFEQRPVLVINMATAKPIGSWPRFEVMAEARLINDQSGTRGPLITLEIAMRDAVRANLDLMAAASKSTRATRASRCPAATGSSKPTRTATSCSTTPPSRTPLVRRSGSSPGASSGRSFSTRPSAHGDLRFRRDTYWSHRARLHVRAARHDAGGRRGLPQRAPGQEHRSGSTATTSSSRARTSRLPKPATRSASRDAKRSSVGKPRSRRAAPASSVRARSQPGRDRPQPHPESPLEARSECHRLTRSVRSPRAATRGSRSTSRTLGRSRSSASSWRTRRF